MKKGFHGKGWLIALTLAFALIILFPGVQGQDEHKVKVYPKDSPGAYSKDVLAGTATTARWIVLNSDNISSYNVRVSVAGDMGTWNVSVAPAAFTLSPNSVEEVSLVYLSQNANLGESKVIEVHFNFTQITSVGVPVTYLETKTASYTVVASVVADKPGLDIMIFGYTLYHIDLPEFMDNGLGRFLISVVLWVISSVIIIAILLPIAKAATSRTRSKYDDIMLGIVRNPIVYAIIFYGVVDSLAQLGIPPEVHAWVYKGISVLIIVMIAFVSYRIFKRVVIAWMVDKAKKTESKLDDVLVPLLDKLGTVAIFIVTCIYLLSYAGINVTVLVAGMGMAGIVIGLAAQDTLANFFSGIHLLIDRPFEIDDTIMLDNGDYCQVRHVGLRSTRLYNIQTDNEVSITNSKIANMQIINVSKPDKKEVFKVDVAVAYDSDLEKVEKILLEVAGSHPDVVNEKGCKPFVRLQSFGDNSIHYYVGSTIKDFSRKWQAAHDIRKGILARFKKEGVEIPFPQRVVHIKKEQ